MLWHYSGFEIYEPVQNGDLRGAAAFAATLPALTIYILWRSLLRPIASFVVVSGVVLLIVLINKTKTSLTGLPMSWNDIASGQNFKVAIEYVSVLQWVGLSICIVSILIGVSLFFNYFRRQEERVGVLYLLTLVLVGAVSFYPYLPQLEHFDKRAETLFSRAGVVYASWDWSRNVQRNGLLLHLIQTSQRTVPLPATAEQINLLEVNENTDYGSGPARPKDVFFVLCEACWNDANNFKSQFEPLQKLKVVEMRAVSPVYGGGTPNSTFEMLTGLPAHGALNGVIFQEYGQIMAEHATTIASALKKNGYETYALHNFTKGFWERSIVYPKFGFSKFVSIEDMQYSGPMYFPRDKVLFEQTLSLLREEINKPHFFNLETVFTHGPWAEQNDFGQKNYASRLGVTISDLAIFLDQVRQISPDALVVVYGDHKPALTRFFYAQGVLGNESIIRIGSGDYDIVQALEPDWNRLGDVPFLAFRFRDGVSKPDELAPLKETVNHMPFYCISAAIDKLFLKSGDPVMKYVSQTSCQNQKIPYMQRAKSVPSWLYSIALFNN